MKDFLKENEVNIEWDLIRRLDDKVNSKIINSDKIKYTKWYIERIEFSISKLMFVPYASIPPV